MNYPTPRPLVVGQPTTTHDPARTCTDCDTRLSQYNPGPWCWVHRPFKKPTVRGRIQ